MTSTRIVSTAPRLLHRMLLGSALALCPLAIAAPAFAGPTTYPSPSPYPISWELQFDHSMP